MISETMPLGAAKSAWEKLALAASLVGVSPVENVSGEFADKINGFIAETKVWMPQFASAATECANAAGESTDEEVALTTAPTPLVLKGLMAQILAKKEAGEDWNDLAKGYKEKVEERERALDELDTAATETTSQTECASIPQVPGAEPPKAPGDVPSQPGDKDDDDKEDDGAGDKDEDPEGTQPHNPGSDRKLPDVTAKPSPGGETPAAPTPSAPTLSDEPTTRLSSDSPAPSATPTAQPQQVMPSSSTGTPQQPSMPQVSMPQSSPTPSAAQQGQQPTQRGNTIDDLKKRMQDAERKSDKDEDKKSDDEEMTGDTPTGDVGGAALVTGATAAGVPGAPTAPTVPGAPTTAPGTPGTPPPGGVGGGPVGGAPAMGSGTNAQAKNANIVAAAQPEPPLPTAPRVEGSQQSPNFDWNSDAVLPPSDGKKDTP